MKFESLSSCQAVRRILEANNCSYFEDEIVKALSMIYGPSEANETIEYMIRNDIIWRVEDYAGRSFLRIN